MLSPRSIGQALCCRARIPGSCRYGLPGELATEEQPAGPPHLQTRIKWDHDLCAIWVGRWGRRSWGICMRAAGWATIGANLN